MRVNEAKSGNPKKEPAEPSWGTIEARVRYYGWEIEEAMTTPVRPSPLYRRKKDK